MNGVCVWGGFISSVTIQTRSIETRAGDSDTTHRCSSTARRKWWKAESGRQTEPQVYYCLTDIKFKKGISFISTKISRKFARIFLKTFQLQRPEEVLEEVRPFSFCWNTGGNSSSNWKVILGEWMLTDVPPIGYRPAPKKWKAPPPTRCFPREASVNVFCKSWIIK